MGSTKERSNHEINIIYNYVKMKSVTMLVSTKGIDLFKLVKAIRSRKDPIV